MRLHAERNFAARIAGLAIAAAVLAVVPLTQPAAQEGAATEAYSVDEVKAAFLYHFGSYVEWPTATESQPPLTIAVLGAPGVAGELARLVPGRTVQGRPVQVRTLRTIGDLGGEEVLFIGAQENSRLSQLIEAVGSRPTLIITDAPNGLSEGAMINFQLIEERVRFEIAVGPAESAGLRLSSRLLSAAVRVELTQCWSNCPPGKSIQLALINSACAYWGAFSQKSHATLTKALRGISLLAPNSA